MVVAHWRSGGRRISEAAHHDVRSTSNASDTDLSQGVVDGATNYSPNNIVIGAIIGSTAVVLVILLTVFLVRQRRSVCPSKKPNRPHRISRLKTPPIIHHCNTPWPTQSPTGPFRRALAEIHGDERMATLSGALGAFPPAFPAPTFSGQEAREAIKDEDVLSSLDHRGRRGGGLGISSRHHGLDQGFVDIGMDASVDAAPPYARNEHGRVHRMGVV